MIDLISSLFDQSIVLDTNSLETSTHSSLTSSASDSEEDFDPGLFGILDNPGVVRFCCLDYPEEVSEYSDDEDLAASEHSSAPDWIRVSYDDLTLDSKTTGDIHSNTSILSRSVEDIHSNYTVNTGRRTANESQEFS